MHPIYTKSKREMYQGASQIKAPENASLFDRRSQRCQPCDPVGSGIRDDGRSRGGGFEIFI